MPAKNAPVIDAMRALSGQFPRFGSRRIRVLLGREGIVVDEYTRECLAIDVAGSIRSRRVIEVLSRLISVHGAPRYLRSDNGPEFVSTALLKWAVQEQIETALIDPGKPWQNGTNESFNGKFRDECLAMEWFRNRIEAKIVIEDWRTHYNEVRPHSSLQYLTPAEFRRVSECSSTTG
ncbi:transposase [Pandoraea horticolens]|uniref:Transposase n=1 Tax=Pandoraea horticolens TaxID=2508298 RepID=A0A5E4ZFH6_9BURK|nr:transposase [Pandoraea horticolens]